MERFNGRVQREVLGITIYSHHDLEKLLMGFNQAYNRRRQRVLKGQSPDEVVRSRLATEPKLVNLHSKPPDPHALPQALQVVAHAKEVSHPDNYLNGEIVLLGRLHGVPVPANAYFVDLSAQMVRDKLKPGAITVGEVEAGLMDAGVVLGR